MLRSLIATLTLLAWASYGDDAVIGSYYAVVVRDIEVATAWYESTLGLRVISRLNEAGRYDIVNLQGPGVFVELLELADAQPRPEGLIHGPFKVGMLVDDLDRYIGRLPATMPRPEVVEDAANGLMLFQLHDPDGNVLQVMQVIDATTSP